VIPVLAVQLIRAAGMASSSREIPQEVWERHKDTILSLRFSEKLPLDDTKMDGRSVMQVMRDEHQFLAT
jgi:hypothetical protein